MSKWFRVYGFADVHDRLLVGAYPLDRDDVSMLEWMKIEHVLNLVEDEEYEPGERNKVEQALYAAGIQEHRLSLTDYGRLPAPKVELAVAEINQWLDQGHRVYVHCRAGWQRSAAIAAGVVALREGVDIEDALARVRRRKPSADPLPQQREDLLRWWADREPGRPDQVGEPWSGDAGQRAATSGRTAAPVDETTAASGRTTAPVDETTAASDRTAAPVDETEEVLKWLAEHDPARRKSSGGDDR
ncbi:MAG TPA: dual specificity protein phosphatase family protein [Solirubrobacteraceae bacterium]|nr:dual specificity protein phosphatase family protein [Solirubrobacteraceae bacterium]